MADTNELARAADTIRSVTRMLDAVRKGDEDAVGPLLEFYYAQMKWYILKKLSGVDRGAIDESQLALDAYRSFLSWVASAPDPKLDDREDIWKMLSRIALCKALKLRVKESRRRNRVGPVRQASALEGADESCDAIARVAASGPGPVEEVIGEDFYRHWMSLLDERQIRIVELSRQGMTQAEIAEEFGISAAGVGRQVRKIKETWARLFHEGDE
jgi:DNA-directed RNA polymerase specialized sigma24 family protein